MTVKFEGISREFFILKKDDDLRNTHVLNGDLFINDSTIDYTVYRYAKALLWEDAHELLIQSNGTWGENLEHDAQIVTAGYIEVRVDETTGEKYNRIRSNTWRLFLFQSEGDLAIFKLRWK